MTTELKDLQTFERVPTLDMVKKVSGVDLEGMEDMLGKIDNLLTSLQATVAEKVKIADDAFDKLDRICPGNPDGQDGFMELTDAEAKAEYDKHREIMTFHHQVEAISSQLHNINDSIKELI
jgi:hypothetical protein